MLESRQIEIARDIDRPEPLHEECTTPADKIYKAHCILLDVLSRINRGLTLEDDWENQECVRTAHALLADVRVDDNS